MSRNTERSLGYMRDRGYKCWMVERFIAFPKPHGQRVDLFNIIDILAINEVCTIGVQSCGSDFSAHKTKMLEGEHTLSWLEDTSRQLLLIGWRKLKKKRGGKAKYWVPRIGRFYLVHNEIIFEENK